MAGGVGRALRQRTIHHVLVVRNGIVSLSREGVVNAGSQRRQWVVAHLRVVGVRAQELGSVG